MKRKPKMYTSQPIQDVLKIETRQDKLGNVQFCVSFPRKLDDGSDVLEYFFFNHLSSALDFIQSNFS